MTKCFKVEADEGYDKNISSGERLVVCKWALLLGMGVGTLVPFAGFMAEEDEWPFTWKYPKRYYEACVAAFVPHLFWVLNIITTNLAYSLTYLIVWGITWVLNFKAWCPSDCFESVGSEGEVIEKIKASTYAPIQRPAPIVRRPKPVITRKPVPVAKVTVQPAPIRPPVAVVNNVTNTNVTNNNQTVNNVNNVTNNVTNVVNNTTVINQVAQPMQQPFPQAGPAPSTLPQNQVGYLDKDGNGIAECGICNGEFNNEELVNRLSCNQFHIYHIKCMQIYLERSGPHPYCPLCFEVIEQGSVKKAVYIIDHLKNKKQFFKKAGSNYGMDPQDINPSDYQMPPQHNPVASGEQTAKGLV